VIEPIALPAPASCEAVALPAGSGWSAKMDGHEIFDQQRTIAPELAELIDAAIVRALIGRIWVSLGESRCISDDTASVARRSSGAAPLGLRRRTEPL
jgi:hypothetical protein